MGVVTVKFLVLKALTEKYTDNQIKGLDPVEGDEIKIGKFWNNNRDLLDFYRKYESLNEKQLMKRYIAESEYLPWG